MFTCLTCFTHFTSFTCFCFIHVCMFTCSMSHKFYSFPWGFFLSNIPPLPLLYSLLSLKKCSMLSLKRSNDFPSLNPSDSSHLADNLYFNIFIFVHISDNLYCKSTRGRLHYRLQNKYSLDRLLLLLQTQCQDDFRNLSGCVLKILTASRILQISGYAIWKLTSGRFWKCGGFSCYIFLNKLWLLKVNGAWNFEFVIIINAA